jgi:hypothetical protein
MIFRTHHTRLLTNFPQLSRFFVYEEYGAKYDLMIRDAAAMYRTMPQWEAYQKGFEALASSLSSMNSQHDNSKKALTIGDLLVKVSSVPDLTLRLSANDEPANSTSVQVPAPICRAAETNASVRLPRFSLGY